MRYAGNTHCTGLADLKIRSKTKSSTPDAEDATEGHKPVRSTTYGHEKNVMRPGLCDQGLAYTFIWAVC